MPQALRAGRWRSSSAAWRSDGSRKKKELKSATVDSKAAPDALEKDGKREVENWAGKPDSEAYESAQKFYKTVVKSFENKQEQEDAIEEYWDIYNAQPDDNLQYSGNSQGYIPAVRDAFNARAKRTLKQLFPANNKHVEAIASDGKTPYTMLSLLEYYIRKLQLRSIVRTDLIAGDVTGQWNLMIDWTKTKRTITKLIKRNPIVQQIDGESVADLELEDTTADKDEDTEDEEVIEEGPEVVDFATEDLAVIPPTCNDLQKAQAVCMRLRLSAAKVQEMVDEGVFILPPDTDIEAFCERPDGRRDRKNPAKRQTKDAGIKTEGTNKHALIFMVYRKLDLGGKTKESSITYYAGENEIIGIIKNPLWSGKVPIISNPVERLYGSFFGKSKAEAVKFLQWQLVDFHNMGQDSAMYSMLPIWAVDPLKAPNWASFTMGLAALWPIPPDSVKPIAVPQLWKESAAMCENLKKQIWESLDINELMMGRMPAGRKNAQQMGGMQQEQSVNITDNGTRYEETMLNPLLEMLFEFDQQFRTEEVTIETRGEIGAKAALETIPPPQWGERYFFRWTGTEYMQGMQRMQQQISTMNVLKGIPPQQLNGKTLDVTPILETLVENVYGVEMAPRILVDKRNQYTLDPDVENELLHNGFPAEVHEADDDPEHLQSHMKAAALAGDPQGLYKLHMQAHAAQLQAKRQMAQAQQQQKGVPGSPGGGPGTAPPPGAAGAPRPGATPGPPRPGGQQPPGAIQGDQMPDPAAGQR